MVGAETRRAPLPDRAVAPLKVFLLGRFEVVRGDAPIPHSSWRRRRPADLLKLTALTAGRVLSRERVIETLWPDKDPSSGANNLHRALYDLRQILGGRFVDLEHGQVRLRPEVWVDAAAFAASAAADEELPALEDAVGLYRGDLCPDDHDSAWLAAPRAELRARFASAALPLARASAAAGDARRAIPLLRRLLDVEPVAEEPQLLLMRLLAEAGRRADALRQFDAAEAALRLAGLGPPAPELRELRERMLRGDIGPAHGRLAYDGYRRIARRLLGSPEPPPLRGRTSSLLLFESLVEQGAGTLVLLGERGVGKSRLAVEGARIAQESGAVVLSGMFDSSRPAPYAAFADLFADYLRAGGTGARDPFAEPSGRARTHEAAQAHLIAAIREQLAALAGGRPLYLLVDELHRADEASANLFHELARSARALRLMLVATCREDGVRSGAPVQLLLSHLDCERLARGVRVQRLDLAGSREQLADLLGTAPGEALATQFYRTTDGSPFYTEELARAFKESGQVKVPEDPAAAVRERVARLGPRVVALLEAAAVAGPRFEFELVKPASGLTTHDALAALEQVLEARIVQEDGAGHHFHHSLVREAIYEALTVARRAALHRAIADAVEARAAVTPGGIEDAAEELAHHRAAGDQPERAFAHLLTAGHRAAARAGLREASAFYERAFAAAGGAGASGPRRLELHEALGQVQLALAELPGAARTFERAAGLGDAAGWRPGPEQRARARRGAALGLLVGGRRTEARAQLDAGLADAMLGSGDERAETLHLLAQLAWHEGHNQEALELARRCADEALQVGDGVLALRGQDLAIVAAGRAGDEATGSSTEVAEPGPEQPFEVHLVLWENDLLGGRTVGELSADAGALRALAAGRQAPITVAMAGVLEGTLALSAGQLDVAETTLREARAHFQYGGSAFGEAFALDRLGALLTARGRLDEGLELLGEGIVLAERAVLRNHALARLHATLAQNRLVAGAVYAAEDALRVTSELLARHGECAVCHALFRPELVKVVLARGQVEDATAHAAELDALAARRGGRALGAIASATRGRVLVARGEAVTGAAALREAAAAWEALGAELEAARATDLAARALRAGGGPQRQEEAEALARAAQAVFAMAGALPERP
ncbi:MAG TPA: AAA family ATPase [Anaeromyxobacteraceae bacterium]|nr:AAA family ATPase [Anaeromyxobacteraceae bacterium]